MSDGYVDVAYALGLVESVTMPSLDAKTREVLKRAAALIEKALPEIRADYVTAHPWAEEETDG